MRQGNLLKRRFRSLQNLEHHIEGNSHFWIFLKQKSSEIEEGEKRSAPAGYEKYLNLDE